MSKFTITPLEETFRESSFSGNGKYEGNALRPIDLTDGFFHDFHGHLFSEALIPFLPVGGMAKISLNKDNYNKFLATLVELGGVFTFAPDGDKNLKHLYLERGGDKTLVEARFRD